MKSKLESGRQYNLTNLFCDERKIIIPDLQRDYCWGDKNHGSEKTELVSGFIMSLIELFNNNGNMDHQLGMIYAYENPINHIQLCDGQQRLTTLYLLMGMLYKSITSEPKNEIQDFLMSDFEFTKDDKEPRLQYAIRESTLYFLSDLVCEFFFKDNIQAADIKKANWYFTEYNFDPTIQSMLSAIKIIEDITNKITNHYEFAKFLLHQIKFFYFDMVNRQHGEEMFVVINTTGAPLTPTENLKPVLVGAAIDENKQKEAGDIWERWEKWFWLNRLDAEHEADVGLNQFLIWYWQIKLKQESDWSKGKKENLKPLKLFKEKPTSKNYDENTEYSVIDENDWQKAKTINEVDKYFEQYCLLSSYLKDDKFKYVLKFANNKTVTPRSFSINQAQDIVLPMLEFMVTFPGEKKQHWYFLRRLTKNYYDGNEWEDRNHNYVDWRHILEIIDNCSNSNSVFRFEGSTFNFKKIPNVRSNILNWYNDEEKRKDRLKIDHREKIEIWEDHQDFVGDLTFLFEVDKIADNSIADEIYRLEKYYSNYTKTIDLVKSQFEGDDSNKRKLSNLVRLFRLYTGCIKVGHISRVSWEIQGVLFSKINKREHFKNDKFKELCASDDLVKFCVKYITTKFKEWNLGHLTEENYSPDRFIITWLTLKVFNAIKENSILSYYDGNETGVSAYDEIKRNVLIDEKPFSLENSICGFAVKSGRGGESYIHYAKTELWQKPDIIDTPFAGIEYESIKRTSNGLDVNMKRINKIIEYMNSSEVCDH